MGLNDFILTCEKDNEKLRKVIEYYKNYTTRLLEENKKKQDAIDTAIEYINCINGSKICSEFNPYLDNLLDMLEETKK